MTTTWTVPRTWVDGEVVGAATGNTHWRDNLKHLKDPPFAQVVTGFTGVSVISATASTGIPITAGVSASLQTYGGSVQCYFQAKLTGAVTVVLNLEYNGTAYTDLASGIRDGVQNETVHYHVWLTGLASGTYDIVPTWQQPNGNSMRIDASSQPLVFWVREG